MKGNTKNNNKAVYTVACMVKYILETKYFTVTKIPADGTCLIRWPVIVMIMQILTVY
jgi:hypothetical protein